MTTLSESVAAEAVRLLAHERDPALLLSALHRLAHGALDARVSVVLEATADGGPFGVSSASGLETSPLDLWFDTAAGAAVAARAAGAGCPLLVGDTGSEVPELAARLGAPVALVAGLPLDGSRGLLVLGLSSVPADPAPGQSLAHAFALAIEWARTRRDADVERELRQAMLAVSRSGAAPAAFPAALVAFCTHVARLLAADRAEIWHHDRRARELVLAAATDGTAGGVRRVPLADEESPVPAGLRQDRPVIVRDSDAAIATSPLTLSVPLRGRRRAIGALVMYGVRVEPGAEADLCARAEQAGHQLSGVLESSQLIEDIVRSRRQLEDVFDSLTELVVTCNARGEVVEANRAFATRLGRARRDLVGARLDALVGAELAALFHAPSAPQAGGLGIELADDRLGGRFVVSIAPLAGMDADPAGRVMVARDVTEARRLDAERQALERRLAQSEKLLALGQFVAGVAHELNNPLQGALGHLELLRSSAVVPRELTRDLALVHRETERAARIVRHLLVFAGSGRLHARALSVNALLTRVLRLRARAHKQSGISVVRAFEDGLPRIQADGMLLQQALLNIILNAEQAMGGRGELRVRSLADVSRGQVHVIVEDSGPGLADEVRGRVFEPFFTTKEVGTGTGLGLAIAFGIVSAHAGTIDGDNRPDGGARFTVKLPVAPLTRRGRERADD